MRSMSLIPRFKKTLPKISEDTGWLVTWDRDRGLIHQNLIPVITANERYSIVGNVWLSNSQQLLKDLEIDVSDWQGTDIELFANLWLRWGMAGMDRLLGMFALIVCDRQSNSLWLIRDSVGNKTLYYTQQGNSVCVASRSRLLKPYHNRELDLIALRDYLSCSFVPGERTLWQGVQEIRPGTVLCFSNNGHEIKSQAKVYWQPTEKIENRDRSLEWHGEQLRSCLERVVREYLPQDRPVGIYLSGGLDSSCITALAHRYHNAPIHTYSLHFGADCPNELEYSTMVAQHCQTQHHVLEITFKQMWNELSNAIASLDDPIGDPLTVPNYLLAQRAKQDVSVILNGEGGDPCFGGPKNQPMLLEKLYHNSNPTTAFYYSFRKCATDLSQLLLPDVWHRVKDAPSLFTKDLTSDAEYINRLMLLNIKYKGADHILTKVNNLTAAANISGLSPLFDRRIVDLAMQTPPEYKLAGAIEKAVLKSAVRDILPPAIIDRPKSGMRVPVQRGFKQYWNRQARGLLLGRNAKIKDYCDRTIIKDWLNYQNDLWGRYGIKLWLLVSLEMWLESN